MAARAESLDPSELEVVVTPMRRRHLRGVLRIEHRVYPRPWSLGLYMSELALPSTRVYLVARVGTAVVGYCGLMTVGEDGHITTVAVDPAWHRRRVGTRLLLALVEQAVGRGVRDITLEVRMSNAAAQTMYRHFGFAPAGVRRGYYVDNAEDAMVMWAHGVDEPAEVDRRAALAAQVPGRTVLEGLS
ncbi:MAG: ribosomal protein S18-alanine N-acetyltransferase [Acidimicrobiia bacterium]|nr:ribosomal protein S18-alanine N-acetyltransferase [Acidimicrobiia bacterium]